MKSLAEQLREYMDRINEVGGGKPHYDFEWTINNPFPAPEGQDPDEWPEEIDVGVAYEITGSYRSGRVGHIDNWTPDEHPEINSLAVYNLETGEDITDHVSKESMERIEAEAFDRHGNKDQDYDPPEPDYDDRDYDDRY